ncbi:MAG: peptidoglycan DD-metalloendopeptidase family protein [Dehalococcoidia bacterium]|nr:peptidoglycan DD-metalloendopeptidase family protein [Dehalococcoidia bacterium]
MSEALSVGFGGGLVPNDENSSIQALQVSGGPNNTAVSSMAAPSPTPSPEPACEIIKTTNIYCVYTVREGDTLSDISTRFGLKGNDDLSSAEMLALSNKPDVADENSLSVGQKLRIPSQSGIIHTVLSAQTLSDIADQYDVSSRDIVNVAVNDISNADSLEIGQEILIPNPTRYAKPAPPQPTPEPPSAAAPPSSGSGSTPPSTSGQSGRQSSSGFMWPTTGPLSSRFGPGHPLGIDIDLFANPNAPILAASSGTVTFAGGNTCCSYGLYVIVDHGNGYQTLYAHLSRIAVDVGQKVNQGGLLGAAGRTGYATGNHLHFEVHQGGAVINPMRVLP